MGGFLSALDKKTDESQLTRITCDSSKMAVEQVKGLASQVRRAVLCAVTTLLLCV